MLPRSGKSAAHLKQPLKNEPNSKSTSGASQKSRWRCCLCHSHQRLAEPNAAPRKPVNSTNRGRIQGARYPRGILCARSTNVRRSSGRVVLIAFWRPVAGGYRGKDNRRTALNTEVIGRVSIKLGRQMVSACGGKAVSSRPMPTGSALIVEPSQSRSVSASPTTRFSRWRRSGTNS